MNLYCCGCMVSDGIENLQSCCNTLFDGDYQGFEEIVASFLKFSYDRNFKVLKAFYWILAVWERFFHKSSSENCPARKFLSKILLIFWYVEVSVLKYWTPSCVVQKLHMEHVNISDICGIKTHRTC